MHLANDLVQHLRVAFHGVGVAPDHAAEGLRLEKLVRHHHPPAAGDHVDRDRRRDAQVGLRRVVERIEIGRWSSSSGGRSFRDRIGLGVFASPDAPPPRVT
jgi:hypothetical protein